jgi:dephospho-CoA kinase
MKIIGLTGGIGSGKTTVANMFQELNVPVYIADLEAKRLMNNSKVIKRNLIEVFGSNAYKNDVINKSFIADKIFNNKELLHKMNTIVHPKVGVHFNKWKSKQSTLYVIKEAAILFENGGYLNCDAVITVTTSEKNRIQRVITRDNSTVEKVKAIIKNQWSDAKKIKLSQYVIINDKLSETKAQVIKIHQEILRTIS